MISSENKDSSPQRAYTRRLDLHAQADGTFAPKYPAGPEWELKALSKEWKYFVVFDEQSIIDETVQLVHREESVSDEPMSFRVEFPLTQHLLVAFDVATLDFEDMWELAKENGGYCYLDSEDED